MLRHQQVARIMEEIGHRRGLTIEAVLLANMAAIARHHGDSPDEYLDDLGKCLKDMRFVQTLLRDGMPEIGVEPSLCRALIEECPGYVGMIDDHRVKVNALAKIHDDLREGRLVDLLTTALIGRDLRDAREIWSNVLQLALKMADRWKIEDLGEDKSVAVTKATSALGELSSMTGAIKMVAINAAIEANRMGEDGAGFRVLATEMHRLSDRAANTLRIARSALTD